MSKAPVTEDAARTFLSQKYNELREGYFGLPITEAERLAIAEMRTLFAVVNAAWQAVRGTREPSIVHSELSVRQSLNQMVEMIQCDDGGSGDEVTDEDRTWGSIAEGD